MLTTLIASRPRDIRPVTGTVVSLVVHVALIAMAVGETANVALAPRDVPVDSHLVYVPASPATKAPPSKQAPTPPLERAMDPTGPLIIEPITTPAPGPDPVVGIPPVTAAGAGLPATDGMTAMTQGTATRDGATGTTNDSAPLTDHEVERPVRAVHAVPPRYPEILRAAGISGSVRARFVVDTSGRVEPASIEISDATHDAFAAAVRSALLATRFEPAEASGHHVRQLVEQVFTFRLQR